MKNKGFLSVVLACALVLIAKILFPKQMDYLVLAHERPFLIPITAFTYMFVHAGFKHFFYNMFFVAPFAMFYERLVGTKHFLRDWILCGLGSALFFMAVLTMFGWSGLLGASGACYGMFALALLRHRENRLHQAAALVVLICLFMLNLIPGIIDCSIPSGIAHMGHVGGILTGVLIHAAGDGTNENPEPS